MSCFRGCAVGLGGGFGWSGGRSACSSCGGCEVFHPQSPSFVRGFDHELVPLHRQHGVGLVFVQVGSACDDEEPCVPLWHWCNATDRPPRKRRGSFQWSCLSQVGDVEDGQSSLVSSSHHIATPVARLLCWSNSDFPTAMGERGKLGWGPRGCGEAEVWWEVRWRFEVWLGGCPLCLGRMGAVPRRGGACGGARGWRWLLARLRLRWAVCGGSRRGRAVLLGFLSAFSMGLGGACCLSSLLRAAGDRVSRQHVSVEEVCETFFGVGICLCPRLGCRGLRLRWVVPPTLAGGAAVARLFPAVAAAAALCGAVVRRLGLIQDAPSRSPLALRGWAPLSVAVLVMLFVNIFAGFVANPL